MAILSKKTRAKNIAKAPPTRKVNGPDGVMVTEKLCPIPLAYKAVDPQGAVVTIPLDNGDQYRDISESVYGMRKWREKTAKGWIRYKDCAVSAGVLAAPKGYTHCEGGTDKQCCEHTTTLIENRKAANTAKSKEFAERFKGKETQMLEAMMATAQAIQSQGERAAGKKGGKGGMFGE